MKKINSTIIVALLFLCQISYAQLTILSGPEDGTYYRLIQDINKALKTDDADAVTNVPSSGAADNFHRIADPDSPYKIALIQSDYLPYMKVADARDKTKKTDNLFVVLPMANEEIHVVTRKSKGLTGLKDLAEKTVSIGSLGQGTHVTATLIKDRSKVSWSSRNFHFEMSFQDLIRDYIDAFIIVGSSPLKMLQLDPKAFVDQLALVPLEDFNDWAKYYEPMVISKDSYKWLEQDINTFGVKSVLVVNKSKLTPTEVTELETLVAGIKSNLPTLIEKGHPKWKEIDFNSWDSADWPTY